MKKITANFGSVDPAMVAAKRIEKNIPDAVKIVVDPVIKMKTYYAAHYAPKPDYIDMNMTSYIDGQTPIMSDAPRYPRFNEVKERNDATLTVVIPDKDSSRAKGFIVNCGGLHIKVE